MVTPLWEPARWNANRVAIIGAGLAGTATAEALTDLGIQCTLFDPAPASGASGNAQGMLYVAPQVDPTPASRFWLQAYEYALVQYQHSPHFHPTGLLTLAESEQDADRLARVLTQLNKPAEQVHWVNAEQASQLLGRAVTQPGLNWPQSGWMAVKDHVSRPMTSVNHQAVAVHSLTLDSDQAWVNGQSFDLAILCNAYAAKRWLPDYLKPRPVRGQISRIQNQEAKQAVCAEGYLTPSDAQGYASFGASFVPNDDQTDLRPDDDAFNRSLMRQLFGQALQGQAGQSRASIRCASPDYLPMVGSLPVHGLWEQALAKLRVDAKWTPSERPHQWQRLMVNIGHGSRGLTSTPLAAAMLGQEITGQAAPCDADLLAHLSPARFLIRALKRGQR